MERMMHSEQLPQYEDLMQDANLGMDDAEPLPEYTEPPLEELLKRFAPRWDNQRVSYHPLTSLTPVVKNKDQPMGPILDRMEEYRLKNQEWHCQSVKKMRVMAESLYHIHSSANTTAPPTLRDTYHKFTLSIVQEKDHLLHRLKKTKLLKKHKKGRDRLSYTARSSVILVA
ncbi:hypothetical protein BC940DRAFT_309327 [Gongronella butleri]|nr:hypothetical protein BC940DRAFT_309327 [Gongronella butleri]